MLEGVEPFHEQRFSMRPIGSLNNKASNLQIQNQLNNTSEQLKKVFQRLSSAQRINQASDDAAGLAISQGMLGQLNGLNMAERNVMDGSSVAQLMDSYSGGINQDLQRMRELAVQASSGTLGDSERSMLNEEFSQLQQNIGSSIQSASFNGQPLLSAEGSIGIKADANDAAAISIPTVDMAADSATGIGAVLDNGAFNIASQGGASSAIAALDGAIGKVGSARATVGATASRLESAADGIRGVAQAQAESRGRIMDADFAREASQMSALQIRQQAGVAMMGQANSMNSAFVMGLLGR
jgi:flagellin